MCGWTPLHCAVRSKHLALTQLLLRAGARLDLAGRDGLSALAYAEKNQHRPG